MAAVELLLLTLCSKHCLHTGRVQSISYKIRIWLRGCKEQEEIKLNKEQMGEEKYCGKGSSTPALSLKHI